MSGPETVHLLAAWLEQHMKTRGVSAADVAADLGVPVATVTAWLSGRKSETNAYAHLDTPAKLGAWLKALIRESGFTVKQIAATTENVSMGTVYNWLRGEHLPPPPSAGEPDRFDALLSNTRLGLTLAQRVQLDEIRRRLTGTSLHAPVGTISRWPDHGLPANDVFIGRGEEIRRLDRVLGDGGRKVVVVSGAGGVGKTTLVAHWARLRDTVATYVDGCLYVNLNGFSESAPMSVEKALTTLLSQLDVDPQSMVGGVETLVARYHKAMSGRKMLVVLDNAGTEPQVRPLLPVTPGCVAVVTSRHRLTGLQVTSGKTLHIRLDTLGAREAASLIRNLVGGLALKTTDPDAIDELASVCGRLPLALTIAAANFLTHARPSGTSLREYAKQLSVNRLDTLAVGPTDPEYAVSATIDRSTRQLTNRTRDGYRLLGLHPGPGIGVDAAAATIGTTVDEAQTVLDELEQANLVVQTRPGRYAFHDLVRDHAARLAADGDTNDAARLRMLDHYLHTAFAAARLIEPDREPIALPEPTVHPQVIADVAGAHEWFDVERPVLLAMVKYAAESGADAHAWRLAWTLTDDLNRRGHWHDWVTVGRTAVTSAKRLNDDTAAARAHRFLAFALIRLNLLDEAETQLTHTFELCAATGDVVGQAHAHSTNAYVADRRERHKDALFHSERALSLFRSAGHRTGEANALNSVGWYHLMAGRYEVALTRCREALDIFEDLNDPTGLAGTWDSIGGALHKLKRYDEAIDAYRTAVAGYRKVDDRYLQADTLRHMADSQQDAGEDPEPALREAMALLIAMGHPDAEDLKRRLADT